MELEKLPEIITGMQKDITALQRKVASLSGDADNKQGVRLLLMSGDVKVLSELEDVGYAQSEVDGIIVPLLDGREVLIYPRYKACAMLEDGRYKDWKAVSMTEIESMYYQGDGESETDELLKLSSPAAKFVRAAAAHRKFNIPFSLLATIAIVKHSEEIDKIANHIEDADLLRECFNEKTSNVWSCSRYAAGNCWCADGSYGYAVNVSLYYSGLAVPLVLYKA